MRSENVPAAAVLYLRNPDQQGFPESPGQGEWTSMWQKLLSLFKPPLLPEEEESARARQLIAITNAVFIGTLIYTALLPLLAPELIPRLYLVLPMYLVILLMYALIQRARLRAASLVMVIGIWVVLLFSAAVSGGTQAPAFGGNIVVILSAAILLDLPTALIFAGLSALSGLGMIYAIAAGLLPAASPMFNTPIASWLAQVIYFIVCAALLSMAVDNIRSALARAERLQRAQVELLADMQRRNTQLRTAAEVSRAVSSILDLDLLLPRIVELIRGQFEYYYVGLFLTNESKDQVILRAATGEMGKRMLEAGHALDISDSSMIGWCVGHKLARIALDVGEDAVRFKNPNLPLTRSEIALPLIARGEVLGAMTIQSDQPSAFSPEDITALQTMSDQVANAIENALLFMERSVLIGELESRNTELERFTYTVSHDLRSPLITMRGFLGFLEQDALAGNLERLRSDVGRIIGATDRMEQLLSELLELSRIGRAMNPPAEIPFGEIAGEALELVRGRLEANNVRVEIQAGLPSVYVDRARLLEVMQNLVDNAAKFMAGQAQARIEIGSAGRDAENRPVFFVRDNGPGIGPEFHERIFGLFNKLDPNSEGTGIGLALVKRIIEIHGGRIWVESDGIHGSTFFFTLPQK